MIAEQPSCWRLGQRREPKTGMRSDGALLCSHL